MRLRAGNFTVRRQFHYTELILNVGQARVEGDEKPKKKKNPKNKRIRERQEGYLVYILLNPQREIHLLGIHVVYSTLGFHLGADQ
jgi:hypothetical protein